MSDEIVSVTSFSQSVNQDSNNDVQLGGRSGTSIIGSRTDLFLDLPSIEGSGQNSGRPQNVILIYDISGSTASVFTETPRNKPIYQKEAEISCKLLSDWGVSMARVVFFSDKVFKNRTPYLVSNPGVLADRAKLHHGGMTYPHLGLDAIPPEWLTRPDTRVLIVTDGQMSESKPWRQFSSSIRKITDGYPDITFGIIAIEATARNYERDENVAAGCDIYRALQNNNLTGRVSCFRAYAHNYLDGYELFTNVKVPAGYVAWQMPAHPSSVVTRSDQRVTKMFALDREGEFHHYIQQQILTTTTLEIYNIVRDLSRVVSSIIRQRHATPFMRRTTIDAYARLFNESRVPDVTSEELRQMFIDSVESDLSGSALLSTNFIADKKARFALANRQLNTDVQSALGAVGNRALTFPIRGRGQSGPHRMWSLPLDDCRHPVTMNGGMTYPSCGYEASVANDVGVTENSTIRIPVVPLERRSTAVTDQCLRQYVRAVMNLATGLESQNDGVKFAALISMVLVVHSQNVDARTKHVFLDMGRVMLEKTMAGSETRELESLRAGHPHPSYASTPWHTVLAGALEALLPKTEASDSVEINIDPHHLWYTICRTLDQHIGDTQLSRNQLRLMANISNDETDVVYGRTVNRLLTLAGGPVEVVVVESNTEWTYQCPLTMDQTIGGGWVYRSHRTYGNLECSPRMVMSHEGYRNLLLDSGVSPVTMTGDVQCLYCRRSLPVGTGFMEVGPRPTMIRPIFPAGVYQTRAPQTRVTPARQVTASAPVAAKTATNGTPSLQIAHVRTIAEAKSLKKDLTNQGFGVRILENGRTFAEQLGIVADQALSSGMSRIAIVVNGDHSLCQGYPEYGSLAVSC